MKSTICEKRGKNSVKHSDCCSGHDQTEDSESFIEDKQALKNAKLNYRNNFFAKGAKTSEIANPKHLPTIFFISSILILSLVVVKFVPQMYSMSQNFSLYKEKLKVKYIPEYFGEQTSAVKVK